jgi:hypothetical protein
MPNKETETETVCDWFTCNWGIKYINIPQSIKSNKTRASTAGIDGFRILCINVSPQNLLVHQVFVYHPQQTECFYRV